MDTNKLLQRVRALLISPVTEWLVIADESATVSGLYREYILVVAAIPALCAFVKGSLIGYAWHGFKVYRQGMGEGIAAAVVGYGMAIAGVYVLAIIIDALAPNFGGQQNRVQALKAASYSYTASWVAGFGQLLPGLTWVVAIVGWGYSAYLLYLGLPATMRVMPGRAAGYTVVTVIVALVLGWLMSLIVGGIAGYSVYES